MKNASGIEFSIDVPMFHDRRTLLKILLQCYQFETYFDLFVSASINQGFAENQKKMNIVSRVFCLY